MGDDDDDEQQQQRDEQQQQRDEQLVCIDNSRTRNYLKRILNWPSLNFYLFQGIKTDLSDEYRLHEYLNNGYNPIVRPVIKPETKIELKFDVALQQLIGVVSKYLKNDL